MSPVQAAGTPVVFRVDSSGNITANGTAIRIKGGSWFGLQGRHEPSNDATNPSGAPMEQYMGNVFWAPTGRTYDQDVAEFKAMGINVVRLPLVTQTLTGTDPQGMAPYLKNDPSVVIPNSRLALETIVKKLDAAGIYVLFDIHSCSNYVDWRKGRLDARPPYVDATRDNYDFKREDSSCAASNNPASVTRIQAYDETKWLADLRTLAGLESSLGVSNIIGIDIYNEPWDYTWAEWKTLTEHAYTAINAVNPNILIFTEGVSNTAGNQDGSPTTITQVPYGSSGIAPNWGGNLYEAGANPPAIPKDRLVFSPHVYGPSVFVAKQFADPAQPACAGLEGDAFGDAKCNIVINPTLLRTGWQSHWGYLKALGYAVVIGEWGGNMDWPKGKASLRDQNRYSYITDLTTDQKWQYALVDYLISVGIYDTLYWSINPESGDTGGLYTHVYDPISNTGAWGTWGALDSRKMTMVHRLWDVPPVIGPTPTPNGSSTPIPPTGTPIRTATPIPPTIGPTGTPGANVGCSAAWRIDNSWGSGFQATVTVSNTGTSPTTSWRVTWSWPGSQTLANYWNAALSQSGSAVTANNLGYNGAIGAGGSSSFGVQVNGASTTPSLSCAANGGTPVTPPPSATPTVRPSATPTVRPSATPTVRPSATPTVRPSATPTVRPSATPTVRPSATPTVRPSVTPPPSGGTVRCSGAYRIDSSWGNGFTATVTVSNPGTVATKSWTVTWTWGGNQAFVNKWNANITQSGTAVTATNMSQNGAIAAGGNTTFGFQASFSGANAVPTLTCSAT
jgi:hypothetical protein